MTANAIVWTVAVALWAGIIALVGAVAIRRVFAWYHSHGRAPAQEPPSPAAAAAARRLLLRLVSRTLRDRTPQHEGATEDFGAELRELRDVPLSPELRPVPTEAEKFAAVHDEFDALMAAFRFDLDHILDGVCRRLDPYWARVDADTREFAVVGG